MYYTQLVNWLLFYRDKLFNKTLDELQASRLAEKEQKQMLAHVEMSELGTNDSVTNDVLPSERNYQRLRLD